jgi:hypothetical protein
MRMLYCPFLSALSGSKWRPGAAFPLALHTAWPYNGPVRRVIRSSRYERAAARLLRPSVQQELEESIAAKPERHPLIPGTGGFRKARWRRPGRGKSGGVRVIYYFMLRPDVVFLADLYAKNEKENLTHAERNQLRKIASEIQREFGG